MAYRDGSEIVSKSWLCKPDAKYFAFRRFEKALNVSHIKLEEIFESKEDTEVVKEVKKYIDNLGSNIIMHSYNIKFDKKFLEDDPWNFTYQWGDDPMLLADKIMNKGRYPHLYEAMENFNIQRKGNPHRAESDAVACLEVYEACLKNPEGD